MDRPKAYRRSNALRGMMFSLVLAALAAGILFALDVADAIKDETAFFPVVSGLSFVTLAGALWVAWHLTKSWFEDVQRLKGALLLTELRQTPFLRQAERLVESGDLRKLAQTMDKVLAKQQARQALAEERLVAVLASLPVAILVITERGLVSLVNATAMEALPSAAIAPGTSVYAALRRDSLDAARRKAEASAGSARVVLLTTDDRQLDAVISELGESGGMVMVLETPEPIATGARLEHALALHDGLPDVALITAETPLRDLPLLVLDCETTGLNPAEDRIVSIGAVLAHGRRVFVHENLDMLVKPDIAIPALSTAIHGIDDAMVSDADVIAAGLARLSKMGEGRVVLGHNIGFDLAILQVEAGRSGTQWDVPHALDTGLLVAALEPSLEKMDLDHLAERYGVTVSGRHTALGDALVAADVFSGLIPLLADRGVETLGEAWAFMARAKGVVARQKEAGWLMPGERHDR